MIVVLFLLLNSGFNLQLNILYLSNNSIFLNLAQTNHFPLPVNPLHSTRCFVLPLPFLCLFSRPDSSKDDSVLSRPSHRRTTKTRSASQIVNNRLSCGDYMLANSVSFQQHQSMPGPSMNGETKHNNVGLESSIL